MPATVLLLGPGDVLHRKVVDHLIAHKDSEPLLNNDVVTPEIRAIVMSGLSLALAGANVIMQLSQLPVGHGVVESVVEDGALFRHPLKRARTTIGYIMIVLLGSENERSVLRRAVNRQHRLVRAHDNSPVSYNAFDPQLQLWVAACMYRGLDDAVTMFYPRLPERTLDELYRHSSRFATTLQVPLSLWPADRRSFDAYWDDAVTRVTMDDVTRAYLRDVASLRFLPPVVHRTLGPLHRFITAGFLGERFRDELGLEWNDRRERVFHQLTKILALANRRLPSPLREFPMNLSLWDARQRIRLGRPLV